MRNELEQADGGSDARAGPREDIPPPFEPPATSPDAPEPSSQPWHVYAVLCATLTTVALAVAVPRLAGDIGDHYPPARIWLGILPLHVGAFGAAMAVLCGAVPRGARWNALGLKPVPFPGWRVVLRGTTLLLGIYAATVALTAGTGTVLRMLGYRPQGSPMAGMLIGSRDPVLWASATVSVLLIAPVVEEILFRLILYEALRPRQSSAAVPITALLFATIHMIPEAIPGLYLLGIVLQKARERAGGSLWAPIALHAAFNAVGLALMVSYHLSTMSTIAS